MSPHSIITIHAFHLPAGSGGSSLFMYGEPSRKTSASDVWGRQGLSSGDLEEDLEFWFSSNLKNHIFHTAIVLLKIKPFNLFSNTSKREMCDYSAALDSGKFKGRVLGKIIISCLYTVWMFHSTVEQQQVRAYQKCCPFLNETWNPPAWLPLPNIQRLMFVAVDTRSAGRQRHTHAC